MALSTADTNKWSTLLERRHRISELKVTAVEYERTGPILQRQRRLTDTQALMLGDRYSEGATIYRLAKEFGICRKTVSERLKKADRENQNLEHVLSLTVRAEFHTVRQGLLSPYFVSTPAVQANIFCDPLDSFPTDASTSGKIGPRINCLEDLIKNAHIVQN